jgi:hypothetical protein
VLKGGGDEAAGYTWTQTDDDVEVRVSGGPSGKGAAKRVKLSVGRGESLTVSVDGKQLVSLAPLFDRVTPDDCTFTLDEGHVVVTMEKRESRPWAALTIGGSIEQAAAGDASGMDLGGSGRVGDVGSGATGKENGGIDL